ncbi:MAG TPA: hypothetical protein VN736_11255 [Candidatus Limnocylindrales bacterium]|nr:hypothetical protein [Candidatus Limnocylindrales bacterium]
MLALPLKNQRLHAQPTSDPVLSDAQSMVLEGRRTFRFDTFGDEAFWGDALMLQLAVEGPGHGGVAPGVSPRTALALGLKVDIDALPPSIIQALRAGALNLDDPGVTLTLLRLNAVVGLTGFFNNSGTLRSIGIQCALCHSLVDNSFAQGIGHRLDGWPNRDLNVGAIVAIAPNLQPIANVLGTDIATVKKNVLNSWGPGKFDAELILDGKAFNPRQVSNGVTTATNVSAATLLPPAFGLAGVNLHTWTGWGSVTHWNAFVANLEMHGKGRFFDPRLNNPTQFPVAVRNGFADLPHIDPDSDLITKKLPALHFYQLAIKAPKPSPGIDFNPAAAKRGDELFSGKAGCNNCHVEPLWTEPGWNLHPPAAVCIDSFQADRAPDHQYRTSPLAGIFTRELGINVMPQNKGRFFHDGRFKTLLDVVNHYNGCFSLGLTDQEKNDLVQYLLSL